MKQGSTRDEILEVALDLFSVNGYEATSISQIADAVGIRKASLYSHFGSKSEILDNVIDMVLTGYEENSLFADADWDDPGFTGDKTGMTAEDAAKILFEKYSPEITVITQGKKGGIIFDGKEVKTYPAFPVEAIDSNGSGDVFHGAFAFAITHGMDYYTACLFSSAVSAIKCTRLGAREGVPTFTQTQNFLKERGINV